MSILGLIMAGAALLLLIVLGVLVWVARSGHEDEPQVSNLTEHRVP